MESVGVVCEELNATPEEFGKYIKDKFRDPFSPLWHLIGQVIQCPLCNRKAVIVSRFLVVVGAYTICRCGINVETGELSYHWCFKESRGLTGLHTYLGSHISDAGEELLQILKSAVLV